MNAHEHPRWPDFHCWFPNQAFREYQHDKQSMIQDLDRVLEETKFPLNTFYELMKGWNESAERVSTIYRDAYKRKGNCDLTQEERHEMDLIVERGKERSIELDKLIDPVYQQMLDMGYFPEELKSL